MPSISPARSLPALAELSAHFQPIVSLKQKAVLGLEALARHPAASPGDLFAMAAAEQRTTELDRACRLRALEAFGGLRWGAFHRPLLFLNFEASLVDEGVVGSGSILTMTRNAGLECTEVVLEVNEAKVKDHAAMVAFVERHRALGFLIALDDLGAGHSNLPRVSQLKPDLIKLDRSLVAGVDRDFHKQETVRSLVALGRSVGALVLAEGVESAAETDACASLGAELFQGFHFCRPRPAEDLDFDAVLAAVQAASLRVRTEAVRSLHERRLEGGRIRRLCEQLRQLLEASDPTGFDEALRRFARSSFDVEAAYLLDAEGLQVSNTHLGVGIQPRNGRLFAPASKGADHSCKEYFFSLMDAGMERFTTDPYISLATGKLCRTASCVVQHRVGKRWILSIDLPVRS